MISKTTIVLLLSIVAAVFADPRATSSAWDFVIVGGGASGCVLADKLSASGKYKVLLLEAGGPSQRDLGGTDYVASSLYYDSKGVLRVGIPYTRYDVPIYTLTTGWFPPTPTPLYPVTSNTGITWSNAVKLLGGSQSHNSMGWMRGTLSTFDSMWGIPGFGSADALKYYIMSENVTGPMYDNLYPSYHGRNGATQITYGYYNASAGIHFFDACKQNGFPFLNDMNGPEPRLGCGNNVYNVRNGVRDTTAMAHLKYAIRRNNLLVLLWSSVTKIVFNSANVATGVQYTDILGTSHTITVNKEVILSAGALNSPKLLLLSGVGNAAAIAKFGIKSVYNNPQVGMNLRNHHYCPAVWSYNAADQQPYYNTPEFSLQYGIYGNGPWGTPEINLAVLWGKSNASLPETDIYVSLYSGGDPHQMIIMLATTIPQMADGNVTLTSADPEAPFNVDLDPFRYPSDIFKLQQSLALARAVLKNTNSTFGAEIAPGPGGAAHDIAWLKANCGVQGHWMGTTRMALNATAGVVDPQFRVYGVSGVRVVDASFFPGPVSGQLQATVVAWAHKAADVINAAYP